MPNPLRKLNVFLCHAKEDKPIVRELYRQLVAEGWLDVWLDEENLFPGQEWDMEIEKAVEQADVVVVCLSSHSVDKEGYVQKELRFVLNIADEKPEGTIFVVPLRLDDCQVPRRIRGWQYADYFPNEERARAYQRLLFSLRMRARKLDISTLSPAEEQARRDAEERARREAEEKARKEKEDKDRKAAEEKARLAAERKAKREREARQKKEAEAVGQIANNAPTAGAGLFQPVEDEFAKEERERKAREERERLTAQKTKNERIAREQAEADHAAKAKRDRLVMLIRQQAEERRKATAEAFRKINFKRILAIGGIILVLVVLFFVGKSIIGNLPQIPVQTSEVFTVSPTFTAVPSKTITSTPRSPMKTPTVIFTPTLELSVGSTWNSSKDGMVMMFVPASEFSMGSDNGSSDEKPVHTVYLDSFWIDKTEVTQTMYAKCEESGVCSLPSVATYFNNSDYADYPVNYVSWYDANTYCNWRGEGMRLPTEAEWEKAASWDADTQEKRIYPWGNSINCAYTNYSSCGPIGLTKVRTYPLGASFYGLLDSAGNVWEWVSSLYKLYPYSSNDGREDLFANGSRVLRGGAYDGQAMDVRSAYRNRLDPTYHDFVVGFRCARSQ